MKPLLCSSHNSYYEETLFFFNDGKNDITKL